MTPKQVDALIQLMGKGRMSAPMRGALLEFFSGSSERQIDIAARHGVSPNGLNACIQRARKAIASAHVLITGVER